jgi:hypothetical protein
MRTAGISENHRLLLFAQTDHLALINDEAKAEAGRLQQICIEEIVANDPSYLRGVCISEGVYNRGIRHI